jgi:hypothetical protein
MSEPSPGTPPPVRSPEESLDSRKEIAAYLNRDVTTAQRWEKREGMPVHRHLHDRMRSVYASRAALDAWSRGRNLRVAQEDENSALIVNPSAPPRGDRKSRLLEPDGSSSGHWQRRESYWPLARASGCSGSSTSGGTSLLTRDFRRSRTSEEWSKPLPCHATGILWRFCHGANASNIAIVTLANKLARMKFL